MNWAKLWTGSAPSRKEICLFFSLFGCVKWEKVGSEQKWKLWHMENEKGGDWGDDRVSLTFKTLHSLKQASRPDNVTLSG